jgi:hypothetical protein
MRLMALISGIDAAFAVDVASAQHARTFENFIVEVLFEVSMQGKSQNLFDCTRGW